VISTEEKSFRNKLTTSMQILKATIEEAALTNEFRLQAAKQMLQAYNSA
jgi:hypothetical protein